ncbi:MAG: DUF4384 domain-containing protein [Deltaproteobacteria bacterium]|nr:DUF4384 domain-containing protein [Deltaproteobacteria bacterium]
MNAQNRTCPSRFDLAHWAAGKALDAQSPVAQHVTGCDRCASYVAELSEARQQLLGNDPARASLQAARSILAAAEERRSSWWRWKLLWPVALLPAAALIGVFAVVDHAPGTNGVAMNEPSAAPVEGAPTVRTKGSFALTVVCKRGDSMFTIADGQSVQAGDRLRFEYTQAQPGFLMVFSVDDAGQIFPYYDEASLHSVPVQAGNQVALPGSVELDDHKGFERVVALWSAVPLSGEAVRGAVTQALMQAGGDVTKLGKLSVDAEQTSYLLARP